MELLSQPLIYGTQAFLNHRHFGFYFSHKYKDMFMEYYKEIKPYFKIVRFFEDKNKNIAAKFILFLFFLVVQDSHTAITALSLLFFLIVYSEFKNNDPLLINKKIS